MKKKGVFTLEKRLGVRIYIQRTYVQRENDSHGRKKKRNLFGSIAQNQVWPIGRHPDSERGGRNCVGNGLRIE